MTLAAVLGVLVGAGLGAPARFATDRWAIARFGPRYPYGTFIVNLAGSAILGALTGAVAGVEAGGGHFPVFAQNLIGTGFCGALTTFSGFSSQVLELSRKPRRRVGTAYASASVVAGLFLASAAFALFRLAS